MLNFDLLTEFNEALIYDFEPETPPYNSVTFVTSLLSVAPQYEDMLNAYLHAQTEILPILRDAPATVDKDLLLNWISAVHERVGKTVLANNNQVAGRYYDETILRWHQGLEISSPIILHLAERNPSKTASALALELKRMNEDLITKDVLALIKLLEKIKKRGDLVVPSWAEPKLDKTKPYYPGQVVLYKLINAFHSNKLNRNEKIIVRKIVTICMDPAEIPPAMDAFAIRTLQRFKECNRENLDEVSTFLADFFYELTDIHPFGNANGRLATCLMNTFSRAFELPSILLRHPGDKEEKSSAYSVAIASIDETRIPLKTLILERIIDAQIEPYSNEKEKQVIITRMALADVMKRIHSKHPKFNLDLIRNELSARANYLMYNESDVQEASILVMNELIELAIKKETELDSNKSSSTAAQKIGFLNSSLTPEQRDQLLDNLQKLSGHAGWKMNQQSGLTVWIDCGFDEKKANGIKTCMSPLMTKPTNISMARRKDNQQWVVKCDSLDFHQINCAAKDKMEPVEPKPAPKSI